MWIIVDTATGFTMPARKSGRGGTWAEFSDDPPRLFREKRHAVEALRWWLDGPLSSDLEGDVYQTDSCRRTGAARQAITTIQVVEIRLERV